MMGGDKTYGSKPMDQVRIVRALLVKSAKPMKRHSMFMSGVDQMLSKAPPSRTILFYKTDIDLTKAVDDLRRALATALVPFYPMAGRLVQEGDRTVIDCNDEGVQLIEAHCDIPFAQLECKNFHIQLLFQQLVPMQDTHETSDIPDAPLASFQVTAFLGGLTVGFTVSHAVADGHAVWMFIKAIGEACRGEPITTIPLHARILLKPEVFTMGVSFPYMPLEELRRSDAALYSGFSSDQAQQSDLPSELAEPHIIHFSHEMLETLKKACTSSSEHNIGGAEVALKSASFVSTYQALAAYLWKRLTMAQGLHDDTSIDLRVSLDVRMRMIPNLTRAYFGNAVVGVPTPMTAGELTSESLSATAHHIWQSIEKADDAYIKKAMTAREKLDLRNARTTSLKVMTIRNASRFPVYEAGNFGWGEPEVARPSYSVWKEGVFTWYPSKKPKSIDVIAPLTSTTCANFFSPHLYPNDPLSPSAFPYSHVP